VHWAARNDPFVQLVYCENGASIDKVFVDGQLVVDGGKVTTVDELALYREIGEARQALQSAVANSRQTVAPLEKPIHDMWLRVRDERLGFEPSTEFR
jgi:5-methylthioadenosine/S-adenosylhomocysteine deaminase